MMVLRSGSSGFRLSHLLGNFRTAMFDDYGPLIITPTLNATMSKEHIDQGIQQAGWKAWSARTEYRLRENQLWSVVQDNLDEVKRNGIQCDIRYTRNIDPESADSRAKRLIVLMAGREEQVPIYHMRSAADSWVYLWDKYTEIEKLRKVLLERRLGLLMAEHIRTGKPLSDWFNTAVGRRARFQDNEGFLCSDKAFYKRVFRALPSEYNPTVMELKENPPLTPEKVTRALEMHEKQGHRPFLKRTI